MFLSNQPDEQIETYKQLLRISGSLSNLFSTNKTPYLNYRLAENVFCKAFGADNESRSDVSVDAVKNKVGVGLKTFLYKPAQVEKVAEFNKESSDYSSLPDEEIVKVIAASRNARIERTNELYDLTDIIYHCVARKNGKFTLYEVPMPSIDLNGIRNIATKGSVIKFSDGANEYAFNKSKSTLFKKFIVPREFMEFPVEIIEDPYELLVEAWNNFGVDLSKDDDTTEADHVVLPLYSFVSGAKAVPEASGLNQWNAGGRARNSNEAYVRIPAWIHRDFEGFLPPRDQQFSLKLPDNRVLTASVCQDGGKALMSNPNSELGQWLLRSVFGLNEGELLTYARMEQVDIDSIALYKNSDGSFEVTVKETGTYENFEEEYKS